LQESIAKRIGYLSQTLLGLLRRRSPVGEFVPAVAHENLWIVTSLGDGGDSKVRQRPIAILSSKDEFKTFIFGDVPKSADYQREAANDISRQTAFFCGSLDQIYALVIRLNPAIRDRVKSGHRERQKT
jgi:hypothetical protein